MIDLNRLYEIAPELAPKNYRKNVRKPKGRRVNSVIIENTFRDVLLENLEKFNSTRRNRKMSSSDRFSGSSTRHFVSSIPSKSSSKAHLLLSNQSLLSAPINYLNSQTFKLRSSKYTNGTKKVYSILDNHGSLTKVSSFFQTKQLNHQRKNIIT